MLHSQTWHGYSMGDWNENRLFFLNFFFVHQNINGTVLASVSVKVAGTKQSVSRH